MANLENIKKWTAALRSGEYKQGIGALHNAGVDGKPDEYCCLGVATVVAMNNGCEIERKAAADWGSYQYYESGDNVTWSGILPPPVVKWLGLEGKSAAQGSVVFDEENYGDDVIALNDRDHWNFNQIADKLDQHFGLVASDA